MPTQRELIEALIVVAEPMVRGIRPVARMRLSISRKPLTHCMMVLAIARIAGARAFRSGL